jgi:DNA-binding transcriptional LysR family regulator
MQNRNPMEVNILIVIIAQEGSFNRAAKKLGITPPSLTRRVASFERSIGVKLFDRSTRNVALTAAGRLFVREETMRRRRQARHSLLQFRRSRRE